jgi:hypothetical protein
MNMLKNKFSVICLMALTVLSCKKVTEIPETDFIDGDKAFATVENADAAAVAAYAGVIPEGNMYAASILSDEVKLAEFPNDPTVHGWSFAADDISLTRNSLSTYDNHYRVIDRANRVLRALPESDSMRVGDNNLRIRLRGEMLAMRAYMHFELWRWYAKNYDPTGLALPYMESPSIQDVGRITMQPYFTKMMADLAEARTLIPANYNDIYRITRNAVIGMQARAALYMRDWAAAEAFATEYITSLPLATRTEFPNIWLDAGNTEVAWKIKRVTQSTYLPGSFYRARALQPNTVGVVFYAVSSKLWDAFDHTNDIRATTYMKDEPLISANPARAPFSKIVRKYDAYAYNNANEGVADYKMFRTGEMYLIRAEARAELNKLGPAAQDLNALRAARISGYTNQNFADQATLIAAIMEERFKELAFEGHRFWDLKRRNLPVERRPVDAYYSSAITLPAGSHRFVMPIPFYEIQANRQMVQNEGY